MTQLRAFVVEVRSVDPRIAVYVDGSFVMSSVDRPGDVDLVVVLPADWDRTAVLRPFEYNVVSARVVRKRYGFDMLVGTAGSDRVAKALDFFAGVNVKWLEPIGIPPGTTKGIVRVIP